MTQPEFVVFCGPMWSSKTSKMLMSLERYKYQKKSILLLKPHIDTRYSTEDVVTHSGWKFPALSVSNADDVYRTIQLLDTVPNVVAVDEMFMIPGMSEPLIWLYRDIGVSVIVSSLDLSYSGKPFPELMKVLPWATRVEKCAAVCSVCGDDARFSYRLSGDDDDIKVGGSEMYEARCYTHHPLISNKVK